MDTKVILKRSATPGKIPAAGDLDKGELALNTADGLLFAKKEDNSIISIGGSPDAVTSVAAGNEIKIAEMVRMTQANYDAIGAGNYQADKLYIIVG